MAVKKNISQLEKFTKAVSSNLSSFNEVTPRTASFYANEQAGKLSPKAKQMKAWAKKNGFKFSKKPQGKPRLNWQYVTSRQKSMNVKWQMMKYTIKP